MQTPLVDGDFLYCCNGGGILTCYEATTGKRLYRERLGAGLSGFTASPVAAGGKLYFSSEDGDVFVVKPGPEFELLAQNGLSEVCMATPAIAGNALYFRTRGHVIAMGERKVSSAWREVEIRSSKDGSLEAARLHVPATATAEPTPLLVLLHTWSSDYKQEAFAAECLSECRKRGWMLIQPDFRGPNRRPEACASELAIGDVLDAVAFAREQGRVDEDRIYLVGTSGGGHMALMMASRAPRLWAGVSAWVPISDLAAWHGETDRSARNGHSRYAQEIEQVCGGAPGASAAVDAEYRRRSPIHHLSAAKGVAIDINAGIDDGHTGSVPIRHSLRAFNVLAAANDRPGAQLRAGEIRAMTEERRVPPGALRDDPGAPSGSQAETEPGRKHAVLFRRQAGPARVTIFEGGHEGDMPAAIRWLAEQRRR